MNEISYDDLFQFLNPKDNGKYFICNCPECNQREAYFYKNSNRLICNRKNHCGVVTVIKDHTKSMYEKTINKETQKTVERDLGSLVTSIRHLQYNVENSLLDDKYRGLSPEVSKDFLVDLQKKEVVARMFKNSNAFAKDYSKTSYMIERNLWIPIYNEQNQLESILMRSTINPKLEPKEVFVPVTEDPCGWVKDIPKQAKTVVISESVMDGLSFREIDNDIGLIMLSGVNRAKKMCDWIANNLDEIVGKHIVVAMDNDASGIDAKKLIMETLDSNKIESKVFFYGDFDYKDPNEFLQKDKEQFRFQYQKTKGGMIMNKEINKTTSEVENDFVCIKNMSLLSNEKAILDVQYGKLTLKNIFVEMKNGIPIINYPQNKGKDNKLYNPYQFKFNSHKQTIESSILYNFTLLKHQIKDKVQYEHIPINLQDSVVNLGDKKWHMDNKTIMNFDYGGVVINNVWFVDRGDGKVNLSLPFKPNYKTKSGDILRYVTLSSDLRQDLLNQFTQKKEISENLEIPNSKTEKYEPQKNFQKEFEHLNQDAPKKDAIENLETPSSNLEKNEHKEFESLNQKIERAKTKERSQISQQILMQDDSINNLKIL